MTVLSAVLVGLAVIVLIICILIQDTIKRQIEQLWASISIHSHELDWLSRRLRDMEKEARAKREAQSRGNDER